MDELIGSKISLTSQQDIRYEGVLFSINSEESSIVLRNVVCFGTEDRVSDPANAVSGTSAVLPFVSFPGSEIKDLMVHEPTEVEATSAPEKAQKSESKPPKQKQSNQTQKSKDNSKSGKSKPAENQKPKASQPQHAAGTGAHLMNLRERKAAGGDDSSGTVATTEFDLQAALSKFTKVSIGADDEAAADVPTEAVYVKDDFFDNLSCDVNDRSAGKPTRVTAKEERVLNQDTFGAVSLHNNYRGGRGGRGRGRGRGGRGRGGSRNICFSFQNGSCDRGDSCRFSHTTVAK